MHFRVIIEIDTIADTPQQALDNVMQQLSQGNSVPFKLYAGTSFRDWMGKGKIAVPKAPFAVKELEVG